VSLPAERRKNRRYTTLNTHYLVRDGICVAVVCKHSDAPLEDHRAIGRRLVGGLARGAHGYYVVGAGPGACLMFEDDLVTLTVVAADRPPKHIGKGMVG